MAATAGPSGTSSPSVSAASAPSRSYFEIVTSNLLRLGALTLEDFLRDPYQEPAPQENFLSNPLYHDAPLVPPLIVDDKDGESKPVHMPAPIFVLHQICSQTFGSIDALNYEIIEEEGKEKKRCILTITRPNGAVRSYTSKPEFLRKAEARAAAAAVAVDMGAIDFIKHGSPEAVAKRGIVLAPLDAPGSVQESPLEDAEEDQAVKEIETCCVEWRAGRVKPRWIFLIDSKPTGKYGCALQIKLSLHLYRVCSVDVMYATFKEAKAACATDAIAEGMLDFIKFGNGQTEPADRRLFSPQEDEVMSNPPAIALTLQGFFEALPRPLPEPVDDKTVAEINAPGWLNTLIQSARGAKLDLKFIWTTDTKLGIRTYLVEPQFPKRADAKNAVCLAALAAGVSAYIRTISEELEAKISPETRTLVFDSILPLLTSEYGKFWPNKLPEMFEYTKDRDACGSVMALKLTEQPKEREKRSWTVPADYRNRNDARVAVVQLAFEQEPPPKGYKVEFPLREPKKARRKGTDTLENDGGNPKKKSKSLSQAEQSLTVTMPSKSAKAQVSGSSDPPQLKPASIEPILLPRPGYVDSKPEPGEILSSPPPRQSGRPATNTPRRPPLSSRQRREHLLRRSTEPSLDHVRGGYLRRPYSYGAREHGHQYELGGARYEDPGVYAPDPYYAPPPAPHTGPWHARASAPLIYPEYHHGYHRPYYDNDHGPSFDYDYERELERNGNGNGNGTHPSLPVPESAQEYDDFGHSGYDLDYAHGRSYARTPHSHVHHREQHLSSSLPSQQPPSAQLGDRTAGASAQISAPRRPPDPSHPPPPPSQSPPRIWEPGPRAAMTDAKRSGGRRSESSLPRSSVAAELEAIPSSLGRTNHSQAGAMTSQNAPASASSSPLPSSLTSTPASSSAYKHMAAPASVPEPTTKSKTSPSTSSSKEELFVFLPSHAA
ncbi:hypothetical protein B0F90DRAFT_1722317 [Multifurca ochricompacta]|uniref:Uncharacterized protein n=1 Tax=Multifurca ochricompacta TaxID=376703 RepID=A0AAD4QNI1_9AGAM|nr:hypothetical protein B0F90DRAFT_1722317 [Multifurca ochricompacta]